MKQLKKTRIRITETRKKLKKSILKNPFRSFLTFIGILVGLIVVSSFLQPKPKMDEVQKEEVKKVRTMQFGSVPEVNIKGTVEKSGIITVVSLTQGVVSHVKVHEGQVVKKGTTLVTLGSNYQGASAPGVQASIAQKTYQHTLDTYEANKDIINKQREIAEKSAVSADEVRNITEASFTDTKGLITLNESILTKLDSTLQELEINPVANKELILTTQSAKAQLLAGNNQAKAALRGAEYQADDNQEPAQMGRLQQDIMLKQLENQQKALDLNKNISRLQYQLASISASLMVPSSPYDGVVQKVFVKKGQVVSPGTPIAVVTSSKEKDSRVVAYVTKEIGSQIDPIAESIISADGKTLRALPEFISSEATNGNLYSVSYVMPYEFASQFSDFESVDIRIPLAAGTTAGTTTGTDESQNAQGIHFIPLESVHQSDIESVAYVVEKGTVRARKITLGSIFGNMVSVESGLQNGDIIILDRNVLEGEKVAVWQK